MTDEISADPYELNTYFIIRDLGSELMETFDSINFEPLFQRYPETLSVAALLPGNHLAGQQDIWLSLWRGHRDGPGPDGSADQMWLKTEAVNARGTDDVIQPVAPGEPGLGLDLPDTGGREGLVLGGVEGLTRLLTAAVPIHGAQIDPEVALSALNGALHEGFDGSEPDDENPVVALEDLCGASGLDSVEFGLLDDSGESALTASTVLDLADQIHMKVWADLEGVVWIDVSGRAQRMDEPELDFPGDNEQEAGMVAALAVQLAGIYNVADLIFTAMEPGVPGPAIDLLNAIAYAAMNAEPSDHGPHTRPWHRWADLFGEHCRLGFLAGVMLEESPFGNLNIRATTLDPATKTATDLQVYWKQDDEKDLPEHWISVGTATGPAHDVDPEYPELLAAIPEVGREYIRHAIDHLHQMVHLAGNVLEAKTYEAVHFLEERRALENVPEAIQHEMVRGTIDDTITGLNGIALLYTGAMPAD